MKYSLNVNGENVEKTAEEMVEFWQMFVESNSKALYHYTKRNRELRIEVKLLKDTLEFYANKDNWTHYDIHSWSSSQSSIKGGDDEILVGKAGYKGTEYYGGKRAREALNKLEEK